MRLVLFAVLLGVLCGRTGLVDGTGSDGVDSKNANGPTRLDQKIAAVLPQQDEDRWLQIPWQANLMQARLDAQRAGKPLLIWIMDGNVLGCT